MPIYDWNCTDCGHVTSEIRKIAERDEPCVCEKCGVVTTERIQVPKNTSFQLKGKGWFKDGY